jgi:hypothetical protein
MAKLKFDWDGLKEKIKEEGKKTGFTKDERFWSPTRDEKGNGMAIIRFLPDPDGEIWTKIYGHNFNYMIEGVKKYWIKNCINTFGYDRDCPICKKNQELYNSSFEEDKKVAGQRKRKLKFTSNILVIKDSAHPENEGQVKLFSYGVKIQEKLQKRITPSDSDLEDPDFKEFMPFDFYEGANFKIKIKTQGVPPNDYPNYDDSEFSTQSELFNGDEKKIRAVYEKTVKLSEFMGEDKFPTNAETITALGSILGIKNKPAPKTVVDDESAPWEPEEIAENSIDVEDVSPTENVDGDLDEDAAFFESLK